jgi:DNA polymerase III subunit alpha
MFAEAFTLARTCLVEDQLVIVEGEVVVDHFSNGYRIRATKAMSLDQARETYAKGLLINLEGSAISDETMDNLYSILSQYRGGKCPIFISYNALQTNAKLVLGDEWKVHPKEELLSKLKDQFGAATACFVY